MNHFNMVILDINILKTESLDLFQLLSQSIFLHIQFFCIKKKCFPCKLDMRYYMLASSIGLQILKLAFIKVLVHPTSVKFYQMFPAKGLINSLLSSSHCACTHKRQVKNVKKESKEKLSRLLKLLLIEVFFSFRKIENPYCSILL